MKKFEYKKVSFWDLTDGYHSQLDVKHLNQLGQDGWELITAVNGEYIFKRQITVVKGYEFKLYYGGELVKTIQYNGGMLSALKTARRILNRRKYTCVGIYKDGKRIKEYKLAGDQLLCSPYPPYKGAIHDESENY